MMRMLYKTLIPCLVLHASRHDVQVWSVTGPNGGQIQINMEKKQFWIETTGDDVNDAALDDPKCIRQVLWSKWRGVVKVRARTKANPFTVCVDRRRTPLSLGLCHYVSLFSLSLAISPFRHLAISPSRSYRPLFKNDESSTLSANGANAVDINNVTMIPTNADTNAMTPTDKYSYNK